MYNCSYFSVLCFSLSLMGHGLVSFYIWDYKGISTQNSSLFGIVILYIKLLWVYEKRNPLILLKQRNRNAGVTRGKSALTDHIGKKKSGKPIIFPLLQCSRTPDILASHLSASSFFPQEANNKRILMWK